MRTMQPRAAVYGGDSANLVPKDQYNSALLLDACRRYCSEHGYQLSEQHIYEGGEEPLWSDAPRLVHLRNAALQGHFEILVVPSLEAIGLLPPWQALQSSRFIAGFYACHIRIESVIARNGTHDVYQQELLEVRNAILQIQQASKRSVPIQPDIPQRENERE